MIPRLLPHRLFVRCRACPEKGRPMHQYGASAPERRRRPWTGRVSKLLRDSGLRRGAPRLRPARILHGVRVSPEGTRRTRATIVEET
jgi:hypothetical protein